MTSSQNSPVPQWFTSLIAEGLAGLYLLNLDGCPASDSTSTVCSLWARLLWAKKQWHQDADSALIRATFVTLAQSSHRWPAPSVFLDHLPSRAPPKHDAIKGPDWGRQREPEAFAAMRAWAKDLGIEDQLPVTVRYG